MAPYVSVRTVRSRKKKKPFTLSAVGKAMRTLGDALIITPAAIVMHRSKTDYVSFGTMLLASYEVGARTTPLTGVTMGLSTLLAARVRMPRAIPDGLYTGKPAPSLKQIVRRVTINTGCALGFTAAALGGLSAQQTRLLSDSPEAQQARFLIQSGTEITHGKQLRDPKDPKHRALGKITIQSRKEPWADDWDQIPWYKPWAKPWIKRGQASWAKLPFHSTGAVTCTLPTPYTDWVTGQKHTTFAMKVPFGTDNTGGQLGPFKTLSLSFPQTKAQPVKEPEYNRNWADPERRPVTSFCIGNQDYGCQ